MQVRRRITRDPNVVQILNTDPRFVETETDRLLRETSRVLEPVEALLFGRSDQPPIANERRRRIPVICINPQYVHLICVNRFSVRLICGSAWLRPSRAETHNK